jgi:hypothetical protein
MSAMGGFFVNDPKGFISFTSLLVGCMPSIGQSLAALAASAPIGARHMPASGTELATSVGAWFVTRSKNTCCITRSFFS